MGTIQRPISIYNSDNFKTISDGNYYKLENDITLNEYMPCDYKIGGIDGQGYSISIFTALFNSIENVTLTDINITANISVSTNLKDECVGSIANSALSCKFTDITGNIILNVVSTENGVGCVGGMIGKSTANKIDNCNFTVNIITADHITGGLIGRVEQGETSDHIKNSSVTGSVTGGGALNSYIGGFIGFLYSNLTEISICYVENTEVTGTSIVGGFIGYVGMGNIDNSYSIAQISADPTNSALCDIGGFIGRVEGYNTAVSNCFSASSIQVTQSEEIDIKIGGFVGMTPGGSVYNIYTNNYYDRTIADIDRIGEGRGDGITKKTTVELQSMTAQNYNFSEDIWTFTTGEYPSLKK